MVSPELLRRYPFFAGCSPAQLDAIALKSQEVVYKPNEVVFASGQTADALYILVEGCVELHYNAVDPIYTQNRKDFFISDINIGEPFGISALIEPFVYVGTVRAAQASRAVHMDAAALRAQCASDPALDSLLLRRMLQATMARLNDTRVLLVASRP